jgi:hypothetical protein
VIVRLLIRAFGGGTLAVVVATLAPVPGAAVLAGFLVFLAVLLVLELLRATARMQAGGIGSAFERALARRPPGPRRPDDLSRLEDQVSLATSAAVDVYLRLRPPLREAAAQRLRARHGVDLDRDPVRARALLGEETWELVRPDLEPPSDRFGPGIAPARLDRVLDALEAL